MPRLWRRSASAAAWHWPGSKGYPASWQQGPMLPHKASAKRRGRSSIGTGGPLSPPESQAPSAIDHTEGRRAEETRVSRCQATAPCARGAELSGPKGTRGFEAPTGASGSRHVTPPAALALSRLRSSIRKESALSFRSLSIANRASSLPCLLKTPQVFSSAKMHAGSGEESRPTRPHGTRERRQFATATSIS